MLDTLAGTLAGFVVGVAVVLIEHSKNWAVTLAGHTLAGFIAGTTNGLSLFATDSSSFIVLR